MIFCLPKNLVDVFTQKLISGEIDPVKLADLSSKDRSDYFKSFLGETNAKRVNTLFESKLLLKNQQAGMINWAKQVTGIKPQVRMDLISRVEKMTEILQPKDMDSFLADLAEQRLGFGVSMEQAGKISDLASNAKTLKSAIPAGSKNGSIERLKYGTALSLFKDYVGNAKLEAKKTSIKDLIQQRDYGRIAGKAVDIIAGTAKSILASLDNSFFGRQGFITLVTKPDIWAKNFAKSWGDIGKELMGIDAMTAVKADVFSRENSTNGKYEAQGVDIGLASEEAFPTSLPAKIPLLGRLYKASESAYNAAALRMRADLADKYIAQAEKLGVDTMDPNAGIGTLVNSMTGRGKISLTPAQARATNVLLFSAKYVKSNLDILTAHLGDKKMGSFARKEAAKNLAHVIGTLAITMTIAKLLDPDSVELDPRSTNFGKILVGENHDKKINISLGMGSILTLASRMVPTFHNGKLGFWTKTSKGRYVQTNLGKFGISSPLDYAVDFLKGKASPMTGLLLHAWEGRTGGGQKTTLGGELTNLTVPIPVKNAYELFQGAENADILLNMLLTSLDLLGVGVSVKPKRR